MQSVIDAGGLQGLLSCLESFDVPVKESAAWALGIIARQREGKSLEWCMSNGVNNEFINVWPFVYASLTKYQLYSTHLRLNHVKISDHSDCR